MLNILVLQGRLTRDPEIRTTQSGTTVAGFTLAVDRDYQPGGTDKKAVKEKHIPQGHYVRMDCPCCETEGAVYLYNRRVSYCALCTACGLRYKIPKEL